MPVRPIRFPSLLLVPILLVALAACGGNAGTSPTGAGPVEGNDPKTPAANEPTAADGGGGNAGGGEAASAEAVADTLAPPNGTEQSRSTAGGLVVVSYGSTDSLESLIAHYESAIPGAGLNVTNRITTQTGAGGANWTFASGSITGSVTLIPSGGSDDGTDVAISVLDTSQ